jgi:hypothetical protein
VDKTATITGLQPLMSYDFNIILHAEPNSGTQDQYFSLYGINTISAATNSEIKDAEATDDTDLTIGNVNNASVIIT